MPLNTLKSDADCRRNHEQKQKHNNDKSDDAAGNNTDNNDIYGASTPPPSCDSTPQVITPTASGTRDLGAWYAPPPSWPGRDQGSECIAHASRTWLTGSGVQTADSDAGKPWQNGTNERFNGKVRDECRNLEWFRQRTEARIVSAQWRWPYNEQRPHSSVGYRTPSQVRQPVVMTPTLSR